MVAKIGIFSSFDFDDSRSSEVGCKSVLCLTVRGLFNSGNVQDVLKALVDHMVINLVVLFSYLICYPNPTFVAQLQPLVHIYSINFRNLGLCHNFNGLIVLVLATLSFLLPIDGAGLAMYQGSSIAQVCQREVMGSNPTG